MIAHQFQARTIRIEFGTKVSDNALDVSNYALSAVTLGAATSSVASVSFYDSKHDSVVLHLANGLTDTSTYSVSVSGVKDSGGITIPTVASNFVATVKDVPSVLGAYLSQVGCIDIVFDRPVGAYSTAAGASIVPDGGASYALSLITWNSSIAPDNIVRFQLNGSMVAGSSFQVNYTSVCDASLNLSNGSVLLTLPSNLPLPISYGALTSISLADAWVDAYVPALGKAYVNVSYAIPALQSSVTNLSNHSFNTPSAHVHTDTVNTESSVASNSATLISLVNDFKTKFNAHISDPQVHVVPAPTAASLADVIRITNELRNIFNIHILNTTVHNNPDKSDVVTVPLATDLAGCIAVLTSLNTKFNTHRTASSVHPSNDTYSVVTSPTPTTLASAAKFVDELRTMMQMHFRTPWHIVPDTSIDPVGYSLPSIICPNASNDYSSTALVMEIQMKYLAHLQTKSHIYNDLYHTIIVQHVNAGDYANAFPVMNALVVKYNAHLGSTYPITLSSIYDNQTNSASILSADPASFAVQFEISVPDLPFMDLNFATTTQSSDSLSTTNTGNSTGSVKARALLKDPVILDIRSTPGMVALTFDKEMSIPKLQDISITTSAGSPVRLRDVRLYSTVRTLENFTRCLVDSHNRHLNSTPHRVLDILDVVATFPSTSFAQIILSLNAVRSAFNAHVTSTDYHEGYPAADAVKSPAATDMDSAVALAAELSESIRRHNLDGSHHTDPGADTLLWKLFDVLLIEYDEVVDGTSCTIKAHLARRLRADHGANQVIPFQTTAHFVTASRRPRISASIPRSAVESGILGRDTVDIFFSKPMRNVPIDSSNFTVTGPSGLVISDARWTGDQTASIDVTGMISASYSMSMSGISDKPGNAIE